MKALILAAGRGKRMEHLTNTTPKPMLMHQGKTLIEHKLDVLPGSCKEVIIVVSYLADTITKQFGDEYQGKKITYVYQDELNGTGGAVHAARGHLVGQTLVMMGDDIYGKDDVAEIANYPWAMGVQSAQTPFTGGKVAAAGVCLKEVCEQGGDAGDFICTGLYMIGPQFFDYDLVAISDTEYGLPQTLSVIGRDIPVRLAEIAAWQRITAPTDLL